MTEDRKGIRIQEKRQKCPHNTLVCIPLEPVFTRLTRGLPYFIDEPFNGLDKQGVQEVYDLIMELNDQGKTIFLVSHNAADIEMLCDTVCEMDAGALKVV